MSSTSKVDLAEFCQEHGHSKGALQGLLVKARPFVVYLLHLVDPRTPARQVGAVLRSIPMPGGKGSIDLLGLTTPLRWEREVSASVLEHFKNLRSDSAEFRELRRDVYQGWRKRIDESGRAGVCAEDRRLLQRINSYGFDDAGNAEAFVDLVGDMLRFHRSSGSWYRWDGHTWIELEDSTADQLMLSSIDHREWAFILDERQNSKETRPSDDKEEGQKKRKKKQEEAVQVPKFFRSSRSDSKVKAALSRAAATKAVEWGGGVILDPNPMLLGTPNGVVDLRTGVLRSGRCEDYITRRTSVPFDRSAECPRFEQFMTEVFGGDSHMVKFVQTVFGYTITGSVAEHVMFFEVGSGANGKTVLNEVFLEVMGSYGGTTPFATFAQRQHSAATNDIAGLDGKRVVFAAEAEEGTLVSLCTGNPVLRYGRPWRIRSQGGLNAETTCLGMCG